MRTQLEIQLMVQVHEEWFKDREMTPELVLLREQTKIVCKPWERMSRDYSSTKTLILNYTVLLFKVILSNLHIVTYTFMLLATIMNGGLLYMPYPMLVFGVALVEEHRPGKKFWYFVLFYT